MKTKYGLVIIAILFASVVMQAQGINKAELIKKLQSENQSERVHALGEIINGKVSEALPVIESEIEKQELSIQPMYLEAMKILGSTKLDEKIEKYVERIQTETKEKIDVKKISESCKETMKKQTGEARK